MNIKSDKGFTLVELLITVALIAILTAIATMSLDIVQKNRLTAASKELYADLRKVRQDAMTRSTAVYSKGFGIRFDSNNSYTLFEFNDSNNNFKFDAGEAVGSMQKTLPSGATVTISGAAAGSDPNILIIDKRGMAKASTWAFGGRTYVVTLQGISDRRCVVLDDIRIREGIWNGTSCNPA